ncbi:hypothetical protein DASC09_002670 [Saccharomycopsis crataegensis]|uniref:Uncharacterized protein n=1 Tax=Saccharomycopsis crataegensis TaxID=43959 RepID=A0AAV5QE96_9ASCO|nr:hypothetical protein DASC09_002670 [Saccharomycopsis crataegensis]
MTSSNTIDEIIRQMIQKRSTNQKRSANQSGSTETRKCDRCYSWKPINRFGLFQSVCNRPHPIADWNDFLTKVRLNRSCNSDILFKGEISHLPNGLNNNTQPDKGVNTQHVDPILPSERLQTIFAGTNEDGSGTMYVNHSSDSLTAEPPETASSNRISNQQQLPISNILKEEIIRPIEESTGYRWVYASTSSGNGSYASKMQDLSSSIKANSKNESITIKKKKNINIISYIVDGTKITY